MEFEKITLWKYGFGFLLIASGLLFNLFGVGERTFMEFGSLGNYLLYIGFLSIVIITLASFLRGRRVVDERMVFVANKAMRIAFIALFLGAFGTIIADGLSPITVPYRLFMAYLVSAVLLVYVIAYRMLLRYS